jgi:hypothetical protein
MNCNYISAYFTYFEKMKRVLCDHHAVCLCICVSAPVKLWMAEPVFIKLGMYIVEHEPISTAYFINPPISLRFYMYIPLSLLGNG